MRITACIRAIPLIQPSLMLFNSARIPTRVDGAGNLLLLEEQDRARWDRRLIAKALFHFAQSAEGGEITSYHLQAGIAACHCAAKDYEFFTVD
jgi:predicted RNA polymerase sigma factor